MSEVPRTATAADANEQRKAILAEVALLAQKRDLLRDEHELYARANSAVKEQFKALTNAEMPVHEVSAILKENFRQRRVDLSTEINQYEGNRDLLKNEVSTLQRNKDAVVADLDVKTAELAAIEAKIPDRRAVMREEERQYTDILLGLQQKIGSVQRDNEKITTDTESKRKEYAEKTAWILKEEMRLATKTRDIAIYEGRVLALGKKVDPNFEMTL
jgi:chromosome segregation ATPase